MSKKIINRNELYEEVWSKPMIELAKSYGLSDVGLAKICKKLNIPRPPVGYWSKLKAGKNVTRPELPEEKDPAKETYELDEKEKTNKSRFPDEIQAKLEEIEQADIKVPQKNNRLHPLVNEAKMHLNNSSVNSDGLLRHYRQECLNIVTSKNTLSRALRIMNTIILECTSRNIVVKHDESNETYAICNGRKIRFRIRERLKKFINKDKNAWSQYELHPTGLLKLEIEGYYFSEGIRTMFQDTNSKVVEEQIGKFIQSIIQLAFIANERDRIREIERRQKLEEKRILQEKLRIFEDEEAKIEELRKNAQEYEESQIIRNYVTRVLNKSNKEEREKIKEWAKWALNVADKIDPTVKSESLSNDEKKEILEQLSDYRYI